MESSEAMTKNQQTVEQYMEGFRRSDHRRILECLTEDVEWIVPGAFHLRGQEAFDKEIENPAFEGSPEIEVSRMIEENDVVIAEGSVIAKPRGGAPVTLAMCDVFDMRDGKIAKLTSYLMQRR
jgi:uncharacterized protein